ncbi:zinc finger protein 891-like [Periophthalmus magnuspinnatus]|uniref:zinc finger protein 891-like n=1 Tax=Periophthalmus magnuspinnatus TaxID=409849 RepID=UPI0024363CA7|nr:zinc finger protein 891-like [Periophthalmus magnuspinnatus]
MSPKAEVLRAQVTERLTAAAHEICALFERTIAEYEEELSRSKEENQRKQRLLDSALSPQLRLHRTQGVQTHWSSPEPSVKEETPETPQIKEEAEEQSLKQEQEALPEFTAVCVKSEEQSSLLQQGQTEPREEAQGELCGGARAHISTAHTHGQVHSHTHLQTHNSSDTDCDEEPPASTSTAHMETEADHREHYDQGQRRDTSPTAHDSGLFSKYRSGAEPRATGPEGPLSGTAGGEKKYECFVCKKRFASKLHLTIHIRVHTGEKPYSCSVCMKTFAQKGNLTAHMKTHTGEKPYSCSICEKAFARMSMLNRHIQVHTGERPYSCSVCKKAFSQKFDMDVHMRSHTSEDLYMALGGGGAGWIGGVSSVQTEPIESVEVQPPTM